MPRAVRGRGQRLPFWAAAGLVTLFVLYAASIAGVLGPNEGAHYSLVRAFADRRLSIDPYVEYTRFTDYARYRDHYYSNRPPGTAALAEPFYLAGRVAAGSDATTRAPSSPSGRAPYPLRVPPIEEFAATLLAALAGVVTVFLAQRVGSELGVRPGAAWAVAFAIGVSTMVWRYSTVLFSHSIAAALFTAELLAAHRAQRTGSRRAFVALGVLAGVSVAVDYSSVVFTVGLVLVTMATGVRRAKAERARDFARFAVAATASLGPLIAYQWAAFGAPWRTSYRFTAGVGASFTHSILSEYSGSVRHLWPMLFDSQRGVVPWNPLLLLAPLGIVVLFRKNRSFAWLLVVSVVPLLVLQAKFPDWDGGGSHDSRIVTPLIAPLLVTLGPLLDKAAGGVRRLLVGAFCVLTAGGFVLQTARLLLSGGHVERWRAGPELAGYLFPYVHPSGGMWRSLFPSARYVPAVAGVGLAGALLMWGWRRITERRHHDLGSVAADVGDVT